MMATIDSCYTRKLDKEEINALPLLAYKGEIKLCANPKDAALAVNVLRKCRLLGFDTEKRPAFKKGQVFDPSRLQLAGDKGVYLFQLAQTGLPSGLIKILCRHDIVKAGVAVARDIRELQAMTNFEPAGFVDLGDKAREAGLQHHGLRGLTAVLLNGRLSKGARLTNWAKANLSEKALRYAATDAWVGLKLYRKMREAGICSQTR